MTCTLFCPQGVPASFKQSCRKGCCDSIFSAISSDSQPITDTPKVRERRLPGQLPARTAPLSLPGQCSLSMLPLLCPLFSMLYMLPDAGSAPDLSYRVSALLPVLTPTNSQKRSLRDLPTAYKLKSQKAQEAFSSQTPTCLPSLIPQCSSHLLCTPPDAIQSSVWNTPSLFKSTILQDPAQA